MGSLEKCPGKLPWGEFGTKRVALKKTIFVVLELVSGPEGRGPVGAHVCTVESGRAQRERQLGRQRPLFLLHPPTHRCCQGTEARGLMGADEGQGLSDDSNLPPSTQKRPRPVAQSSHQAGGQALAQAHSSSSE